MAPKKTKYDMLVELLTDWENGGRLDLLLDAILNHTGLVYSGLVTTYTNATSFASLDLAGFGDGFFDFPVGASITGSGAWLVQVVRDDGGAAALPQGEFRLVTAYVSATGTFTHEAFSANMAAGDRISIIHLSVLFSGVQALGTLTTSSLTAPADTNRTEDGYFFSGMCLMMLDGAGRFESKWIREFAQPAGVFQLSVAPRLPTAPGLNHYALIGPARNFTADEYNGTYSHPNGVAEDTLYTYTMAAGEPYEVKAFWLDMINCTQNTTVRLKTRVDGVNYRTFQTYAWTVGDDPILYFPAIALGGLRYDFDFAHFRITVQSALAEGAARDMYYRIIYGEI